MTVSNEPGYYEEGAFGIRIENICVTVRAHPPCANKSGKNFFAFETVTLVPLQRKMIDLSQLTDEEIDWLYRYHALVREKLTPLILERFPEALNYLNTETQPIRGG